MAKISSYAEKLKDPRWQKKRLEILQRDNFSCTLCGDSETELHIHHTYYSKDADPWEYEADALLTHCKHCHASAEVLKDEYAVPLITAKRGHNDGIHVTISCMSRLSDGKKVLFICLYDNTTNYCHLYATASEETSKQIKHLVELSEKL